MKKSYIRTRLQLDPLRTTIDQKERVEYRKALGFEKPGGNYALVRAGEIEDLAK